MPIQRRFLGLALAFGSQCAFTLLDLCAQYLQATDPIDAISLAFLRGLGGCIPMYTYLHFRKSDESLPLGPPKHRKLLMARSVLATTGLLCFLIGIRHLPLSDTATIVQIRPFILGYLSNLWLAEGMTFIQIIASIVSLGGEVLMLKPTFLFPSAIGREVIKDGPGSVFNSSPTDRFMSVGLIFITICVSCFDCEISPFLLYASYSASLVLLPPIILLVTQKPLVLPSSLFGWSLICGVEILAVLCQVMMAKTLELESAVTLSLVGQLQVIPGALIEFAVYHSHLDSTGGIGVMITTISGIVAIANRTEVEDGGKTKDNDVEEGHGEQKRLLRDGQPA